MSQSIEEQALAAELRASQAEAREAAVWQLLNEANAEAERQRKRAKKYKRWAEHLVCMLTAAARW